MGSQVRPELNQCLVGLLKGVPLGSFSLAVPVPVPPVRYHTDWWRGGGSLGVAPLPSVAPHILPAPSHGAGELHVVSLAEPGTF